MFCTVFSLTLIPSLSPPRKAFSAQRHISHLLAFNAKGDIDIEDRENEVIATFTLGASSNGVDPKPKRQPPSHGGTRG